VYATDAMEAGDKVAVVAAAPAGSHKAIEYPAVVLSSSQHFSEAARFLNYLVGPEGATVLAERGFSTVPIAYTAPTSAQ
jgi:molybdate transport system substrate-binding protein